MRLLVVEDNEKLAGLVGRLLREHGLLPDAVSTIDEARAALRQVEYDALLLDLALPDGDGQDLLRHLRRVGNTVPVLVATARTEVIHRIQALNDGADDYLIKPFSLEELLARIRAVLRRPRETRATVSNMGNVAVDTLTLETTVNGARMDLSRGEARVLAALLQNGGRLLPRERLEQAVYSFDREVSGNALEATVSRLRRRLEAEGATVTVTAMRGLGYILNERTI